MLISMFFYTDFFMRLQSSNDFDHSNGLRYVLIHPLLFLLNQQSHFSTDKGISIYFHIVLVQ